MTPNGSQPATLLGRAQLPGYFFTFLGGTHSPIIFLLSTDSSVLISSLVVLSNEHGIFLKTTVSG